MNYPEHCSPLGYFGQQWKNKLPAGLGTAWTYCSPSLHSFLNSQHPLAVGLRWGSRVSLSLIATLIHACFPPPWIWARVVAFYWPNFRPAHCHLPKAHPQHVHRFLWSQQHGKTTTPSCDLFPWASERMEEVPLLSIPRDAHISYPRMITDIPFSGNNPPHPDSQPSYKCKPHSCSLQPSWPSGNQWIHYYLNLPLFKLELFRKAGLIPQNLAFLEEGNRAFWGSSVICQLRVFLGWPLAWSLWWYQGGDQHFARLDFHTPTRSEWK